MTQHHYTFHPLLVLAALVVLPAYSYSKSDSAPWSDPGAGRAEEVVSFRVYYLFDPADPMQLQRADEAHQGTFAEDQVEWFGVRPTSASQVALAPFALADMLAEADHLPQPPVLDWLKAAAGQEESGDRILVENTVTGRTYAGVGTDMQDVIAAAGLAAAVSTDVGVTTWGKVKELFR